MAAGPSGSAKTTLLRLCNRLELPTSCRVLFLGAEVAGLDPTVLRRRVGMVFQRPTQSDGTVRDDSGHTSLTITTSRIPEFALRRCSLCTRRCSPSTALLSGLGQLFVGELWLPGVVDST